MSDLSSLFPQGPIGLTGDLGQQGEAGPNVSACSFYSSASLETYFPTNRAEADQIEISGVKHIISLGLMISLRYFTFLTCIVCKGTL